MISVQDALDIIRQSRPPKSTHFVPLLEAAGSQAAEDVKARLTMPPFDASAMDGYAVQLSDVGEAGQHLRIIGEAPAGTPFTGTVSKGEAVRIFTGSPVPPGADHILIQENATRDGDILTVNEPAHAPRHIRKAGIDFHTGDILIPQGKHITAPDIAVAAAGNHAKINILKRPKVAIIASGDELREPGSDLEAGQIISSNSLGLAALVREWGGDPKVMGIAKDTISSIRTLIEAGDDADIFLPIGGASVGDYDFMKAAFKEAGFETRFEKVAVRPGKPTWFGARGSSHVLGLPGNPASAYVCAHLFLKPLLGAESLIRPVPLMKALPQNGPRESYLRGRVKMNSLGALSVEPFPRQDSSLITPLTRSNGLIRLPANTGPWAVGDLIDVLGMGSSPDILDPS